MNHHSSLGHSTAAKTMFQARDAALAHRAHHKRVGLGVVLVLLGLGPSLLSKHIKNGFWDRPLKPSWFGGKEGNHTDPKSY